MGFPDFICFFGIMKIRCYYSFLCKLIKAEIYQLLLKTVLKMFKTYVNPSTDRTLMRPAGEEDTETVENQN